MGREPGRVWRGLVSELKEAAPPVENIDGLRPATKDELEKVLAVNASMAFEEGGISPLQSDPSGFRSRTARRVEKERVWVWIQDNRLVFKADGVGETPEVTDIEGVYVHEEERR